MRGCGACCVRVCKASLSFPWWQVRESAHTQDMNIFGSQKPQEYGFVRQSPPILHVQVDMAQSKRTGVYYARVSVRLRSQ